MQFWSPYLFLQFMPNLAVYVISLFSMFYIWKRWYDEINFIRTNKNLYITFYHIDTFSINPF